MLVREWEYKTCEACGDRKLVKDEAHGCDQCAKVIDFQKQNAPYHRVTVFKHSHSNVDYTFCSVACFVKWLRAFKPPKDYNFISFPLLSGRADLRRFQEHLK